MHHRSRVYLKDSDERRDDCWSREKAFRYWKPSIDHALCWIIYPKEVNPLARGYHPAHAEKAHQYGW